MKNIAFIFTGIGNIKGGGGAERFFSDFYDQYQTSNKKYNLFFITDEDSLINLNAFTQLNYKKNITS